MTFPELRVRVQTMMPGVLVAVMIALASKFVSEHYGAPSMLLALLFGISLNFLATDERCGPGIAECQDALASGCRAFGPADQFRDGGRAGLSDRRDGRADGARDDRLRSCRVTVLRLSLSV